MAEAPVETRKKRVVKPPEERSKEILAAALELFATKGFDDTTIQDIATAAGVATGTVYLYFPSKEHVLLGIHEDFHRGIEEAFGEVFAKLAERRAAGEQVPYTETIDQVLEALVGYSKENRRICEVIARFIPRAGVVRQALSKDRTFVQMMAASFEHGISHGVLHTTDPEMMAYLLNAAVSETVMNSIVYGVPPDVDRVLAAAKELFHKALAPKS
ncbi:MAG: TetR/AcrR family transcriptional regulator [Actinomycetota bacterium]